MFHPLALSVVVSSCRYNEWTPKPQRQRLCGRRRRRHVCTAEDKKEKKIYYYRVLQTAQRVYDVYSHSHTHTGAHIVIHVYRVGVLKTAAPRCAYTVDICVYYTFTLRIIYIYTRG